MKRLASLVALLSIAVSSMADVTLPSKDKFLLVALVGQSNMSGRGIPTAADLVAHPRVVMMNQEGEWVPCVDPIHFDAADAGVGPGKTFAEALANSDPSITVGVIPCAVGGTSITSWVPGASAVKGKNTWHPYDDCVERITAAQEDGTLVAILCHQGESDCMRSHGYLYQARFPMFIKRLRTDVNAEGVPLIVGQLSQTQGTEALGNVIELATGWFGKILSKTQQYTCEYLYGPGKFVPSLASYDLNEDGIHFTRDAQVAFGGAYYAAYQEVKTALAANPAYWTTQTAPSSLAAYPIPDEYLAQVDRPNLPEEIDAYLFPEDHPTEPVEPDPTAGDDTVFHYPYSEDVWLFADGQITDGFWTFNASASGTDLTVNAVTAHPDEVSVLDFSKPVVDASETSYTIVKLDTKFSTSSKNTWKSSETTATEHAAFLGELILPPEGLKNIADGAFANCSAMTHARNILPDSVTTLGRAVFLNDSAMEVDVFLRGFVGQTSRSLFYSCSKIKSVTFGPGLTGTTADGNKNASFQGCAGLTNIVFDPAGHDIVLNKCTFSAKATLTQPLVLYGVKTVGESCFANVKVAKIVFDEGLETINATKAFDGNSTLSEVRFLGAPPTSFSADYNNASRLITTYVPWKYREQWLPYSANNTIELHNTTFSSTYVTTPSLRPLLLSESFRGTLIRME